MLETLATDTSRACIAKNHAKNVDIGKTEIFQCKCLDKCKKNLSHHQDIWTFVRSLPIPTNNAASST